MCEPSESSAEAMTTFRSNNNQNNHKNQASSPFRLMPRWKKLQDGSGETTFINAPRKDALVAVGETAESQSTRFVLPSVSLGKQTETQERLISATAFTSCC